MISKSETEATAHLWTSDGSGTFEISQYENFEMQRGTKIILHLRPDNAKFSEKAEI